MFGIISDIVDTALQPVKDIADVADGILDGEIREDAVKRLVVDAVGAYAITEAIDHISDALDDD